MQSVVPITDKIYWVGVNDRETDLFESLWPIPRGVVYNSYLIDDDKTVLVDSAKGDTGDLLLAKIRSVLGTERKLDYLVVNHMEPDHSGMITRLREVYPQLQIIGNRKTAGLLKEFYGADDNLNTVGDGDELRTGSCCLQFHLTPMVHWPETMMTLERESGVLFSGDAFGAFGALDGGIFDDEVDDEYFRDETIRYFANIVAKYSRMVLKALDKLRNVKVSTIAATHGPVWRRHPQRIIDLYARLSRQEGEKGLVVAYGSMYRNTRKMAEAVARGAAESGLTTVRVHDVSRTHPSYVLRDAWNYRALALGAPTYDTGLFPAMDRLVRLFEEKKIANRQVGIFGTYGWSGGGVKALQAFAEQSQVTLVEPVVEACCAPSDDDLQQCVELGRRLAAAAVAET